MTPRNKTRKLVCRLLLLMRRRGRAFSLIELLVAVTIFALAIVIAVGAFSLSLGNQSYISANTEVNLETERIIRQISDDIINANGIGSTSGPGTNYNSIKGLIFVNGDGSIIGSGIGGGGDGICFYHEQLDPVSDAACDRTANLLALFYKNPDRIKIYRWSTVTGDIWSQTISGSVLPLAGITTTGTERANSQKVEISKFGLTGATCTSVLCNQQPFAGIDLGVRTKGYDQKSPAKRAKFFLRTRVESRIQ